MAKVGCRVIAAARRVDRLKSLCDEINGVGSGEPISGTPLRAVAIELDVSADGPAIEAAVERAWDAFGRIDALINNAGIRGRIHTPLDLTEEEWNDITKTNLTGTWLVSKYVCLRMCNSKLGGSIVNISSIAGLNRPQALGGLAYATSKTALNALTRVPLFLLFLSPFPSSKHVTCCFFVFLFCHLQPPLASKAIRLPDI
nr:3-oxoacyl-[acyl-carrier-protein] reductase FabG-like [Ipomoea batatas]